MQDSIPSGSQQPMNPKNVFVTHSEDMLHVKGVPDREDRKQTVSYHHLMCRRLDISSIPRVTYIITDSRIIRTNEFQ